MDKKNLHIIGETVRSLRKSKGLSQEQLADAADTTHTEIGRLERGERNITISSLEKIAAALEVEIFDFFATGPRSMPTDKEQEIEHIRKILVKQSKKDIIKVKTMLAVMFDEDV